jgi:hypothetical protein
VVHSPSCGEEHEKRTAECRDRSVSFSEHHRGRARITVASPTGIELAWMAAFLCHTIWCAPKTPARTASKLSLIGPSERATTASGQDQRLTKSDSDKGAAIIPIDAQPLGTHGFGRAAGRYDREDFRPSSIGRTRSGLWELPRP